jgi:hypothetical protein
MIESSQLIRTPLLPAELRYFAAARDDWELLLLRARQLGANTIATCVPWAWHAPTIGTIDFEGITDSRRNLVGFVRLCARLDLGVILHPGPLHAGALLGGGTPAWLLQQYPQACALDPNEQPWLDEGNMPRPCALHPDYLAAARSWITAFSQALLALQAPHGPIVALHAGTVSRPDQIDYNDAARSLPGAPDTERDFRAWYDSAAGAIAIGWLHEQGWCVPIRGSEISLPNDDFRNRSFASTFAGTSSVVLCDLAAANDHPLINAAQSAINASIRVDGSAGPDFWHTKIDNLLIGAAGLDYTQARVPADLALAYSGGCGSATEAPGGLQALAGRLRQAQIAFDLLDLDTVTPNDVARYTWLLIPATCELTPAIQQQLAQCANIAILGDQKADTLTPPHSHLASSSTWLPADVSAEHVAELVEERGAIARYAWADGADIHLNVRYGERYTYLLIANQRPAPYNGLLAYRGPDGAVLHLHVGIGAGRAGMVQLISDEVYGAAIDGDGSEGGWLARGLRSSALYNTGAGALARCGDVLLLTAPQSGRFQARWAEGWAEMTAYRLLLSGVLLPAYVQIDATHLSIPYQAEDALGQTDMYLVLPNELPLPHALRDYLASLLVGRAAALRHAAELAGDNDRSSGAVAQAATALAEAAARLDSTAALLATLDEYGASQRGADDLCQPAVARLALWLTQTRGALLRGEIDPTAYARLDQQIERVVAVATRASGI